MAELLSESIYNIALWVSITLCLAIIGFFLLKLSLKKYYRHVYHKYGIDGFQRKYGKISSIFAKPDEILGLKKRTAEYEQSLEATKNLVYMYNYQEYLNMNIMYKDDAQIVGINEPIGPMTQKIHQERGGKGFLGFNLNKFMGGYWVNYVMMGKDGGRSTGKDERSI